MLPDTSTTTISSSPLGLDSGFNIGERFGDFFQLFAGFFFFELGFLQCLLGFSHFGFGLFQFLFDRVYVFSGFDQRQEDNHQQHKDCHGGKYQVTEGFIKSW